MLLFKDNKFLAGIFLAVDLDALKLAFVRDKLFELLKTVPFLPTNN